MSPRLLHYVLHNISLLDHAAIGLETEKNAVGSHGDLAMNPDNLTLAGNSITAADALFAWYFLGAFDLSPSTLHACSGNSLGLSHRLRHG